jgi:hypothetical protein
MIFIANWWHIDALKYMQLLWNAFSGGGGRLGWVADSGVDYVT